MNAQILDLRPSQRLLLELIRYHSPVTRAELSRLSGLTAGAITQYCRDLMFLGLVIEGDRILGQRGQPSLPLRLNPSGGCSLGISFSPGQMDFSVVDLAGNKLFTISEAHQENQPLLTSLDQIQRLVQNSIKKRQLNNARVLGIGYAIPGYLRADGKKRYCVSWLENWRQFDLHAEFSKHLTFPTWVENNANAAAIGEYFSEDWKNYRNISVIDFGYGIGAGAIVDGQLLKGGFSNAGEVGIAFPSGTPRPSLKDLLTYLESSNFDPADLMQLIDENHPIIERWLEARFGQIEQVLLGCQQWLDPQLIILGGTLPITLVEKITVEMNKRFSKLLDERKPKALIVSSKQGVESASLGAAKIPLYQTLNGD